jgi:LTXXQ motif family protein
MLQSYTQIAAAFVVLSTGITMTTAEAQPHKAVGAPAAHAAPAPRAAPAPHAAPTPHAAPAPHVAAPRTAPQASAPHSPPQRSASHAPSAPRAAPQTSRPAPQQSARPSGTPSHAARTQPPATQSAPATAARERPQTNGQGGQNLAQPNARDNAARERGQAGATTGTAAAPPAGAGRNAIPRTQPEQTLQPSGGNRAITGRNQAIAGGVLRNQFFADRSAARDPAARALTRSTFQGRFFDPQWRRRYAHPIVIGWAGPLFWPYAYNDFVDYTFYPYAYDTFWPYAYDDLYGGMFGAYAQGYGGTYAAIGRRQDSGGGRTVSAELCSGQTAGLTDWPIERIAQTVVLDDTQRGALDQVRNATARALDILKAACPTELPSTPTGRIAAMGQRLTAMLQAVRIVRPVLETFYQSLNDEQKARFNALGPDESADQQRSQRDLTQVCGERASGIASLPLERIERAVRTDERQQGALKELQDATSQAVDLLRSGCPSYRPLTPVARLEAMEQRLDAMLRAVQTVQPALEKFYGSLGDEQKERFNRLGPARG